MDLHDHVEALFRLLRRHATLAAGDAWERVTAVLFMDGPRLRTTAIVSLADGRDVDPIGDAAAAEITALVGPWLDACLDAGLEEWKAVLATSARTGTSEARILYPDSVGVEDWHPSPETFRQVLARVPEMLLGE